MNEPISLSHYLGLCQRALEQNKPEYVNDIYELLKARHPEFRSSFKVKFQTTLLNHYLIRDLKPFPVPSPDLYTVFTAWEKNNPAWRNSLAEALDFGKVETCAGLLKESFGTYVHKVMAKPVIKI
ncbi:hypothetical protein [Cedecea sp. P7760]|uniref:hypothetical protein n=1 Tax=Cedecea sp. P7760 TaxID=2726983 RepID=UPI0015A40988|nr:hypothetical protein [Cedecea sp. P7760]NWC63961.1 hypothetical protein [Cedecea sp. P7760]